VKSHAALEAETFDATADGYDAALQRGIAISGESKEYFARERVRWLSRRLAERAARPRTVLDFGCGDGTAAEHLLSIPGVQNLVGVDTSSRLLNIARARSDESRTRFEELEAAPYEPFADLAFCNGVFHHIQPSQRLEALGYINRALRPGGYFALWENNPWSPAARYVMSRIPFDRGAQMISPPAARQLLREAGFDVVKTDWLFIFPRMLRVLRPLEAHLVRAPLGAQYLVLCVKPAS
jgi:SAM-dependent methyltransferase